MDEILGIVTKQYYTSGLKRISTVYKDMVNQRKNLDEWALNFFQSNLASFREVLGDFDKSYVTEYLEKVFQQKCSTSLDALYETFRFEIFHNFSIQKSFKDILHFKKNLCLICIVSIRNQRKSNLCDY